MVGVEVNTNGMALVHLKNTSSALPCLHHCEFIRCDESSDRAALLAAKIQDLGLQKLPCRYVLGRGHYQFLLVEAPKVPAEELNEALRWRIKDLLGFSVDKAVIDAFLLPGDSARAQKPMAYVAVVEESVIRQTMQIVADAHLELVSIDIPELALRNLAVRGTNSERGLAVVHLIQGGGALLVIRNKQVYLSRQFDLDYNGGLLDELPDEMLALELQRSFDYYERQMRQVAPADVVFLGENITSDKITEQLKENLSGNTALLEVTSGLQLNESIQSHLIPLCFLALGAALRDSVAMAVERGCE